MFFGQTDRWPAGGTDGGGGFFCASTRASRAIREMHLLITARARGSDVLTGRNGRADKRLTVPLLENVTAE